MDPKFKLTIHYHRDFLKRVQKYPHKRAAIDKAFLLFQQDCTNPKLKVHKLTGKLTNMWAFSIDHHLRVLFYFENGTTVVFSDIGTHEIYR